MIRASTLMVSLPPTFAFPENSARAQLIEKAVLPHCEEFGLAFAMMIGVSVATLRNWEQGRRTPDGPALALLRVAAQNPQLVAEALHGKKGAA